MKLEESRSCSLTLKMDVKFLQNVNSIATGYRMDDQWAGVLVLIVKNFHFSISSRWALGTTQPPMQRVTGGGSFPRGEAAGEWR
jgi:hypothetical protein